MKRFARTFCIFGSIVLASAILVFYISNHIPDPWGAGTLPGGLGHDESTWEKTGLYQARIIVLTSAAAAVGILYLMVGAALRLACFFKANCRRPSSR